MELHGRTALVTGASRGIGRSIAIELARMGADLILVARDQVKLKKAADDIAVAGRSAAVFACDLSRQKNLMELIEKVRNLNAHIDILINNAGIYSADSVAANAKHAGSEPDERSIAIWSETIAVNLSAPFILSAALAPYMVQKSWGRIVNVSSISGKKAEVFGTAYSASKFGLVGLTQSLALELARHGVTVNAVCPGWVETDMALEQINDPIWCGLNEIETSQSLDIARLSVPQMRFITPYEVASLVGYLCSDRAKGITGQAINICGGLSIT